VDGGSGFFPRFLFIAPSFSSSTTRKRRTRVAYGAPHFPWTSLAEPSASTALVTGAAAAVLVPALCHTKRRRSVPTLVFSDSRRLQPIRVRMIFFVTFTTYFVLSRNEFHNIERWTKVSCYNIFVLFRRFCSARCKQRKSLTFFKQTRNATVVFIFHVPQIHVHNFGRRVRFILIIRYHV